MTIFRFEIKQQGVTKRTHNRLLRKINRQTMLNHRERTLGRHYKNVPETQPGGAYGYEPRTERYLKNKQRKKGHQKPLVWSGQMRRTIRNRSRITATRKGAKFRARNYFPLSDQRRDELEVITRRERREMAKEAENLYAFEAAKPKNQRKRKKKVRRR